MSKTHWNVEHDNTKCALCVVCARNCPNGAVRRDETGEDLLLYYNASMCDGCDGDKTCQTNCPEEAIKIVQVDSPPENDEHVLLMESKQARCEFCNELFAPVRRIDVVASKKATKHEIERVFCPLCRRTNLVVSFIEKYRLPGEKAKYRSQIQILRDSGKLDPPENRKEHLTKPPSDFQTGKG